MSRSFLPDWLAAAAAADTTAHVARRQERTNNNADNNNNDSTADKPPVTNARTPTKAKTPTKARAVRAAPTPNPQLAEALARIKSEAVHAVRARAPTPSRAPTPPVAGSPEHDDDPEAVVARLVGRGLQPLDADVPVLAAARRRKAGEARIAASPSSAAARRPVPAARLARSRKRSLGARFNDATPSFLDSDDDADPRPADDDCPRSTSPSSAAPGRKMFRKVTTLATTDVIALASTVPDSPSPSPPPSYEPPPPPPPRASTPQPPPPPPPAARSRRARDLFDDVAPELSPVAPARAPTPPPPVVASFYRYELGGASADACSSPPSLSPDAPSRTATRSPSLLAPPLPDNEPTADESTSTDAFARFEPAFLRRDFLP